VEVVQVWAGADTLNATLNIRLDMLGGVGYAVRLFVLEVDLNQLAPGETYVETALGSEEDLLPCTRVLLEKVAAEISHVHRRPT
jgi:hypothetical protein